SDRINSILVPQTFMDFTNKSFRDFKPKGSSRLIVLVENPYSDVFQNFLKDNGYELSTGRLIGGEIASMIRSLITAVAAIGFLIVLLSVLVFVLNFQLIVSKSSRDIGLMMQLGYKQNQIAQILKKHLLSIFGIVLLLTIVFFTITRYFIVTWFAQQGMTLGNIHWVVFVAALLFSALFVFINFSTIQKSIKKLS
ncbi:MAG TPA: FtsX-like permease family protein, partial [Phaeodactylibacter sp.]|nr:FtsX-like permease family protein [Phaeodactylibacter sp.]